MAFSLWPFPRPRAPCCQYGSPARWIKLMYWKCSRLCYPSLQCSYSKLLLTLELLFHRGVLCQSIIRAQAASPTFTHVYAALVAILNTKVCKDFSMGTHCYQFVEYCGTTCKMENLAGLNVFYHAEISQWNVRIKWLYDVRSQSKSRIHYSVCCRFVRLRL